MNRLTSNGIAWIERPGPAHPIVFLHGIGANAASFEHIFARMKPGHRLLAWDAPGYGRSDASPITRPTARDYAEILAAGLRELAARRCIVVGHSLGCLIAGSFAAHWPDMVAAVLFASPALGHRMPAGGQLPPSARARIDDFERLGPEGLAKSRAPLLVAAANRTPEILNVVAAGLRGLRMPGYAQTTHLLAAGDLVADAMTCPAQVVTGEEDAITPPKGGDLLLAALNSRSTAPQAVHHRLPGCGHMLFDEAPDTMRDLVIAFTSLSASLP